MRNFWLSLPFEKADAWRRCVLWPAARRWEETMTSAERAEQRRKISEAALAEDRSARNVRMWAKRSARKRKTVGAAIARGLRRFWATAPPGAPAKRSAAARAGWALRRL
jgi:hypothetical protein